jgi:hypothetical protein
LKWIRIRIGEALDADPAPILDPQHLGLMNPGILTKAWWHLLGLSLHAEVLLVRCEEDGLYMEYVLNSISFHSQVTAQDICGNSRFSKMVKAEHWWQNKGCGS